MLLAGSFTVTGTPHVVEELRKKVEELAKDTKGINIT